MLITPPYTAMSEKFWPVLVTISPTLKKQVLMSVQVYSIYLNTGHSGSLSEWTQEER